MESSPPASPSPQPSLTPSKQVSCRPSLRPILNSMNPLSYCTPRALQKNAADLPTISHQLRRSCAVDKACCVPHGWSIIHGRRLATLHRSRRRLKLLCRCCVHGAASWSSAAVKWISSLWSRDYKPPFHLHFTRRYVLSPLFFIIIIKTPPTKKNTKVPSSCRKYLHYV